MLILNNKELRHLKAMFKMAIDAYPYETKYCLEKKKPCKNCKKIRAARDYLATLKPNG